MKEITVQVQRFEPLHAWTNRILRVDLSAKSIRVTQTAPYVPDYLAARGLAHKIAWEEYPEPLDGLDPQNPLMVFPGVMTGAHSPYSGRTNVCSFAPHGYPYPWFTRSNIGGRFGGELKRAGYDGIIVTGASDSPVRIRIHDDEVSILAADELWGVDALDTLEALEVIERSIAINEAAGLPQNPAILHLHIHVTEMSDEPERAMQSANTLANLCPDAGHMNHMPGHTYVLCGEYEKAKHASEKAIRADNKYVDYAGPFNFYTTARAHDLHLMMYTCMFLGQFEPAMAAADQMCATLSKDVLGVKGRPQLASTLEGYYSMKLHVLVRFGRWQGIIDMPMPDDPELYCVSTAMHHYAKGVAHATLRNFDAAEEEIDLPGNAEAGVLGRHAPEFVNKAPQRIRIVRGHEGEVIA